MTAAPPRNIIRWPMLFALLTVIAPLDPIAAAEASRPNILWIIAEDFGPQLSCYGTPQVRTPNIDRLAAQGVRYTRAFTVTPVCSTSRSSFMTGMYATTIGAHNHRSHRDDGYRLPDGVQVITDRLRKAGYFTANIRQSKSNPQIRGTGKTDWNFTYGKGDQRQAYDTAEWDELKSHQPFYAQINFSETHRGRAWDTSHTIIDQPADPEKVEIPPYYPDHPVTRKDWAQYLNTAMALDVKVGRVLKQLEADGLAENTVVIFFGDHGRAHVRGKQWCYDTGLHVPLIIRWPQAAARPDGFTPGTVDDRLVASIDWTAQTLDIAGVEIPADLQGRVFLGPEAQPPRKYVFGTRDRCDETVFRIRTVRDERYRYIRNFMPERPFLQLNRYKERSYPVIALMRRLHAEGKLNEVQSVLMQDHRPAEELYDLQEDPHETHNLADSPEHRETVERMRKTLAKWIEETGDQGRTPEPPEVVEAWERKMRATYEKRKRNSRGGTASGQGESKKQP